MPTAVSRRGLILVGCPLLLAAAAATGLICLSPQSQADSRATLESARLLLAGGDLLGAERALREIPGAEARSLLRKLLAKQGRWKEARELLVESSAQNERSIETLRILAQGAMEIGDFVTARQHLVELEKSHPRDSAVLKALAVCLLQLGDPLGAMSAARRGLAIDQNDSDLVRLMSEAVEASSLADAGPRGPAKAPQSLRTGRRRR